MTLSQALKTEKVIEVSMDEYLADNGRVLKYDRYYGRRGNMNMWIDEAGNAFKNFCDAYYCVNAYKWA